MVVIRFPSNNGRFLKWRNFVISIAGLELPSLFAGLTYKIDDPGFGFLSNFLSASITIAHAYFCLARIRTVCYGYSKVQCHFGDFRKNFKGDGRNIFDAILINL